MANENKISVKVFEDKGKPVFINVLPAAEVIQNVNDIVEDLAFDLKRAKSPKSKRTKSKAITFYASALHHLKELESFQLDKKLKLAVPFHASREATIKQIIYLLNDWKDNIKHFDSVQEGIIRAIRSGHARYVDAEIEASEKEKEVRNG